MNLYMVVLTAGGFVLFCGNEFTISMVSHRWDGSIYKIGTAHPDLIPGIVATDVRLETVALANLEPVIG